MKKIFLIIGLLISVFCFSQTKKQFKTASWGNEKWGYIYKPATPGKYPLILFFHGIGEVGTSSADADRLLINGPLAFVKTGWKPSYLIIAIQVSVWSPAVDMMKFILDNDSDVKTYWDGKNVLWTGLSAGGQRVCEAMAAKYPGTFVPMSPAGIDFGLIDFTTPKKVWDFHADNDPTCPYIFSKNLIDRLNTAFAGSGKLTTYHGGHGGWNTYYDPNYREDGMNIYDFAFSGYTPPVPTTKKIIITVELADGKKFYVYDDGSYELK